MTKWMRYVLMAGLACGVLTCGALAATPDYTTDEAGSVTYADGSYTATYADVQAGEQYVLLVVEGTPEQYSVSSDTILYIDQKAADNNGVSFSFIPKSTPDSVVLLGGQFADGTSPKVLGTLIGQGVTVSGKVTLQGRENHSGATVTLTGAGETFTGTTAADGSYAIDSVPEGTYTLEITMGGYLSYTKKAFQVDGTEAGAVQLVAGDINDNTQVEIGDLTTLLGDYMKEGERPADLNGNTQVEIADLSLLLSNYMKQATVE